LIRYESKLRYDPIRPEPIAIVSYLEQVFVVSRRVPAETFAALVKYSKDHPNTLNYGSVGIGSAAHLVTEWLRTKSGGDWKHVPFNGSPKVQAALASGDIHMTFTPTGNVVGRIASGDLKALLTAGEHRNPLLPAVPTFAEAGLPALGAKSWAGLFAPAGTPQATIARLHREFSEIASERNSEADTRQAWPDACRMGLVDFKTFIPADQRAWEPLIKQVGRNTVADISWTGLKSKTTVQA
jgi:tripartite-type tricarboxylate transporter receptor subunit TctC